MTVAYDHEDMAGLIKIMESSPSFKGAIYSLTGDCLHHFLTVLQAVRCFV